MSNYLSIYLVCYSFIIYLHNQSIFIYPIFLPFVTYRKDKGWHGRVILGADEAKSVRELPSACPDEDKATLGEYRGVCTAEGGQHDEHRHAPRQDAQDSCPECLQGREEERRCCEVSVW